MTAQVAIRLGTTGKSTVIGDFAEIGEAGDRGAQRWARAYERAGADVEAALQRQANAAMKVAAIAPQTPMQRQVNAAAGTGFGNPEGSARESALAFQEIAAAEAQLEARTRALLSVIDPVWAAQDRFNSEMVEAKSLVAAGAITLDQYCDKLRLERGLLDQTTAARGKGTASVGQMRAGAQQLSYQIGDVTQQFALGTPVMTIFAQQGGQVIQALQLMTNKTTGFLGFMAGPWGAVITGGVMILGMLAAKLLDNSKSAEEAEKAMQKFQQRQSDIKNFIDDTTGALKEQNKTLVLNAMLTRQAQIAENEKEIAKGRIAAFNAASDFRSGPAVQSAMAREGVTRQLLDNDVRALVRSSGTDADKLATGLAELAKRRPEIKGLALDVSNLAGQSILLQRENARLGLELRGLGGDTTALAHADSSLIEARAKLAGATNTMDRAQAQYTISIREADAAYAASKKTKADETRLLTVRTAAEHALNVAQDANRKGSQGHAQTLARNASAMEVNADAALGLARAYLTGGDAILKAEAARKGLTDATRKGIEGEAQVRRQLAIMVGDALVNGAKSVDQMRGETDARLSIIASVEAGTVAYDKMGQALEREAALRPLLKLAAVAQGEQLSLLTRVIDEQTKALDARNAALAQWDAIAKTGDANRQVADIKAGIFDLTADPLTQAVNAAKRKAEADANAGNYTGQARTDFVNSQMLLASAQYAERRAQSYISAKRDQEDSLAMLQRETALIGANDNFRSAELNKLQLILTLKRQGLREDDLDFQTLVRNQEALDAMTATLAQQNAAWDELRQTGGDFIDTVFNPDNWSNWGDLGKKILHDLEMEFLKLAAINPLKNMLYGSNLPTATSVWSLLSGGGGGGGPDTDAIGALLSSFKGGFSTGTQDFPGGWAMLGENGQELAKLPGGTKVFNASDTRRMLSAQPMKSGDTIINMPITFSGAVDLATRSEVVAFGEVLRGQVAAAITDAQRRAA